MRDTRIDLASGIVAVALLGLAVSFAYIRWPGGSRPPETADWRAVGRETYRAECASCHPAAAVLARVFDFNGGRDYPIDLLLRGDLRSGEGGKVLVKDGHPAFDHLTNEGLAAVINHVATGGGDGRFPAGRTPITAAEVRARRDARR